MLKFSHKNSRKTISFSCLNNFKNLSDLIPDFSQHLFVYPVDSRYAAMHEIGAFFQGIFFVPQIKESLLPWSKIAFFPEIFSFLTAEIWNDVLRHAYFLLAVPLVPLVFLVLFFVILVFAMFQNLLYLDYILCCQIR